MESGESSTDDDGDDEYDDDDDDDDDDEDDFEAPLRSTKYKPRVSSMPRLATTTKTTTMKAKQTPKSAFAALRSSGGTAGRKRPRPAGRENEPDPPAATLKRQPLSAPEIQSLVNSMRSVLGESTIDETTARMHLFHCNYNLEAAINRHFNHAQTHGEQSHREGRSPKLGVPSGRSFAAAAASAPKRPVKNAFALLRKGNARGSKALPRKVMEGTTVKMSVNAAENVKQYTLGWGLVQGQSTTTGKGIVHAEQEIFIWRESSSSKFIRFGVQQGIALGKLSRDVTAFLAPLMDAGGIRCSAKVQSYPEKLTLYNSVQLLLCVRVSVPGVFSEQVQRESPSIRQACFALARWLFPKVHAASLVHGDEQDTEASAACARNGREVDALLSSCIPQSPAKGTASSSSSSSSSSSWKRPRGLGITLRSYQREAVRWMVLRESQGEEADSTLLQSHPLWLTCPFQGEDAFGECLHVNPYSQSTRVGNPPSIHACRGGILADEMGMGKTVEFLALLLRDKEMRGERPSTGSTPTLIVVPMTVLSQWADEIRNHTLPGALSFCVYYGNEKQQGSTLLNLDVVLTSFGTLAAEVQRGNAGDERSPLLSIFWRRIALDEAHTIKNQTTNVAKACCMVQATMRWAITGTPMQNGISDLFSLFRFLRHEPWSEPLWWNRVIEKPFHGDDENMSSSALDRLKTVLSPIMLRRTKDNVDIGGSDGVGGEGRRGLPERALHVTALKFSSREHDFYASLYSRSKAEFDGYANSRTLAKNYAKIMTLLLRLRQACDHPFLVLGRNSDSGVSVADLEGLGQYQENVLASVMERGTESMECAICLDSLTDPVMTKCGHILCRQCLMDSMAAQASGTICPVCREPVYKSDIVSVPERGARPPSIAEIENDAASFTYSAKLHALVSILKQGCIGAEAKHKKAVVFSQWTYMLDLVGIVLKKEGFHFVRLDGSMNQKQRETSLRKFRTNPGVNIFLMSLRAGSLGLNLTAASMVILLDPWWNPAVEEQAIDRVHRFGQSRDVEVYRLIIESTCEEKILRLQEKKAQLSRSLLSAGSGKKREGLGLDMQELKAFFA